MARKDPFAREVKLYTVTVPGREIAGRVVEERTYERFGAISRADAIRQAVRWTAAEFGLAGWKPWLREMCAGVEVVTDVVSTR